MPRLTIHRIKQSWKYIVPIILGVDYENHGWLSNDRNLAEYLDQEWLTGMRVMAETDPTSTPCDTACESIRMYLEMIHELSTVLNDCELKTSLEWIYRIVVNAP